MSHTAEPRPYAARAAAAAIGLTAALGLAACASSAPSTSNHAPASHQPSATASPAPRSVVSLSEANKILDTYQNVNNRANATRDAKLLATVEAGQLYARSKAEFEQLRTLSEKEQKNYGKPFTFTDRTFYLPAGGDWFAAQARTGKDHAVMVFEKSPATANAWKKVVSLFPAKALPPVKTADGVARTAPAANAVGPLSPDDVPAAVEDLFATGGTKQGAALARTGKNAKSILKTHKERGKSLGPQAKVSFFPATPVNKKVYTLRTRDGVLAIAPLAHNEESLVLQPGLQITPGKVGSVYDKSPRPVTVDVFQGETLMLLPEKGRPDILDYRYAQTDSR
ncbi:hypothetical protein OG413_41090 [Streptomyces sp. NBC_01433]|uniref:hypothetical protein n=1 Tax=Streptomyces sp. NBC_01433 TaxID=2903864 RepID=UPI0022528E5B|nr:hypothetical protein [Streptomyces sp. NBC_01433]MCX4681600.1 hypothetical protein [Streptomyces sp. NBC_01433]